MVNTKSLVNTKKVPGRRTVHYDTFDVIAADPQQFAGKVREQGGAVEIVEPGGDYAVS